MSDDSIINAVAGRASCAFSDAEHGAAVLTIGGPKAAMWPPGQDPRTPYLYLGARPERPRMRPLPGNTPMTSNGSSGARFLARRGAQLMVLLDALTGVVLTEQDRRLASWLAGWRPATVQGLAGLIRRARGSAPDPGRGR